MVTAVSLDGMVLHGYVHEHGDVGHLGRAGIFPAGCVVEVLHSPTVAVACRNYTPQDRSELAITEGDEILVTAKCPPTARPTLSFPSRQGFLHKQNQRRQWQKRWCMLAEGRLLYLPPPRLLSVARVLVSVYESPRELPNPV